MAVELTDPFYDYTPEDRGERYEQLAAEYERHLKAYDDLCVVAQLKLLRDHSASFIQDVLTASSLAAVVFFVGFMGFWLIGEWAAMWVMFAFWFGWMTLNVLLAALYSRYGAWWNLKEVKT